MKNVSIIVRADWDEEAGVWVASTTDIQGLAVEAETLEALRDKIVAAVSDLVEVNGGFEDGTLPDIPVRIMSEQIARIPNPCH